MSSFMHSKERPRSDETNGVKTRFATLFGCKIGDRSAAVLLCTGSKCGAVIWAQRNCRTDIGTVAQQEGDDIRMRPEGGLM
jgi:hypothetical protein